MTTSIPYNELRYLLHEALPTYARVWSLAVIKAQGKPFQAVSFDPVKEAREMGIEPNEFRAALKVLVRKKMLIPLCRGNGSTASKFRIFRPREDYSEIEAEVEIKKEDAAFGTNSSESTSSGTSSSESTSSGTSSSEQSEPVVPKEQPIGTGSSEPCGTSSSEGVLTGTDSSEQGEILKEKSPTPPKENKNSLSPLTSPATSEPQSDENQQPAAEQPKAGVQDENHEASFREFVSIYPATVLEDEMGFLRHQFRRAAAEIGTDGILNCVKNWRQLCERTGKINSQYVKKASFWLRDGEFRKFIRQPSPQPANDTVPISPEIAAMRKQIAELLMQKTAKRQDVLLGKCSNDDFLALAKTIDAAIYELHQLIRAARPAPPGG